MTDSLTGRITTPSTSSYFKDPTSNRCTEGHEKVTPAVVRPAAACGRGDEATIVYRRKYSNRQYSEEALLLAPAQ